MVSELTDFEALSSRSFDVSIFVCGYEARSTFVYSGLSKQFGLTVVLDYDCQGVLSYDAAKSVFSSLSGAKLVSVASENFAGELADLLQQHDYSGRVKVIFDVSCGSRRLISNVLGVLDSCFSEQLDLTCVYALSEFYEPPTEELPSHISEPVIGSLSGWSDDLVKPPCAVIGLGFEPGRAIGCLDYLEIPEVRLFVPFGPDQRFVREVLNANHLLIQESGENAVLPYSVLQPNDAYLKLESLVFGLVNDFRPVLIPLGPKIFSVVAIVLAMRMSPRICVWRTSSGSIGKIHDIRASGEVSIFNVGSIAVRSEA